MVLNKAMLGNMHPKFRLQDATRIKDVKGDQFIKVMHRIKPDRNQAGMNFMQQESGDDAVLLYF